MLEDLSPSQLVSRYLFCERPTLAFCCHLCNAPLSADAVSVLSRPAEFSLTAPGSLLVPAFAPLLRRSPGSGGSFRRLRSVPEIGAAWGFNRSRVQHGGRRAADGLPFVQAQRGEVGECSCNGLSEQNVARCRVGCCGNFCLCDVKLLSQLRFVATEEMFCLHGDRPNSRLLSRKMPAFLSAGKRGAGLCCTFSFCFVFFFAAIDELQF